MHHILTSFFSVSSQDERYFHQNNLQLYCMIMYVTTDYIIYRYIPV